MTEQTPPKKVFDIMRPGRTPAPPTSRPLIVGHKPELHESFIGAETGKANQKRPLLSSQAKVTIQPDVTMDEEQQPQQTQDAEEYAPAVPETISETAADLAAEQPQQPLSSVLIAEAEATPQTQPKLQDMPPFDESSTPQAFVSHHRTGGLTLGMALLTILVIIVFAATILDVLLDAGIIKTTVNIPHTNFF